MSSKKGKEKVVAGQYDEDKTGRKRNRNVLQFFEDSAFEVDGDDSSDDDFADIDDFLEDEFESDVKVDNEPTKVPVLPFIKEEEMNDEELEKMVEERYGPGSTFVTYAEDGYESKRVFDRVVYASSSKDPILWKVKCMVGRERHSVFCLMQKAVELQLLGAKLQIISAFTADHLKGFIYIEADKQSDVYEACKGITSIYSSRVIPVPKNEFSHVLSVRSKSNNVTKGTWARVKNGKYKGDLAEVVAVNEARKKVTVKLIPRIDLRALAEKFGGGVSGKKMAIPAARLISASELEEFRPLIQSRRDRDTNKTFEILDGMMLKDGYLYKKVSLDSLSLWGVTPNEDELLKFEPSNNDESNDLEWLSDLYGDRKKKPKRIITNVKGSGKGEGSSSSIIENNFEVHDLVFFGRKDFGVIIGTEKDDCFKVMKEGMEAPLVVTIHLRDLKNASFDKKLFTALDHHMKAISINDKVRVFDGPLKDREGIVKQIYRGTIFLYNESEQENNGCLCIKAQKCEKVISPCDESHEKEIEPGPSGFGDFSSSPKSPLSPKKSWQGRENSSFNREDKDGMFTVGQSLRIRVGPLKGYLCRVLAVRRFEVTVKLDSQQRILTVKREHLAEVRGKSSATSLGEDHESLKPFDLLGTTDGSTDWIGGVGSTAGSGSWNTGGLSTEGNSWAAFPASSQSMQPDSGAAVPADAEKGDSAWDIKPASSQNPAWGAAAVAEQTAAGTGQVDGWGKHESWNKSASTSVVATGTSDSWGKAVESRQESAGQENSWGHDRENPSKKDDSSWNKTAWGGSEPASAKETGTWGNTGQPEASEWKKPTGTDRDQTESWSTKKSDAEAEAGWVNSGSSWGKTMQSQDRVAAKENQVDSWGGRATHQPNNEGGSSVGTSWNTKVANQEGVGGSSWSKPGGPSSWANKDNGPSWNKPAGGSSWGQQADDTAKESKGGTDQNKSWGKQNSSLWSKDGGSSCSKPEGPSWAKLDGGSSWSKPSGGSFWGQQADTNKNDPMDVPARNDNWGKQDNGSTWSKQASGSSWNNKDSGSSWNNKDSGSSWNNKDGGSSWSKPAGFSSWGQQGSKGGNRQSDNGAKQEGGSSWSQRDGGSSWNSKQGGGSSWGQPTDGTADDSRGTGVQNDKQGKQEAGSSWNKGAGSSWGRQDAGSSWNNKQDGGGSSWGQPAVAITEGSKDTRGQNDNWGKKEHGSSWSKPSGGSSWGQEADAGDKAKQEGGSSWGKPAAGSTWAQQAGVSTDGQSKEKANQNDSWSKQGGSSSWNTKDGGIWNNQAGSSWDSRNASEDNSSAWNQKSFGNMKDGEKQDGGGGWNAKMTSEGGSSTGWGQSNWQNSGVDNDGGNQNSAWSSKSNWSGGSDFGGSEEQTGNSYRGRGRGGNWRGGRGGRGESGRSGFGGRDGSDQGGFGGRDGSGRGGFGGRDRSERGGFGGRGRSDRGGFRGRGRSDRGGFGGRGRGRSDQYGDWNRRDDSGEDKAQSWYKSGNNAAEGGGNNDFKGNWSQGGGDSGQWKSWSSGGNQLKEDTNGGGSAQVGWSRQESSWKTSDASGGWNDKKPSWDQGSTSWGGSASGHWNKASGTDGGQSKQLNEADKAEAASGGNAQTGWSRQEKSWKASDATGGWNQGSTSTSGSTGGGWSKPSGPDGSQANRGNGSAERPANSWGKANAGGW